MLLLHFPFFSLSLAANTHLCKQTFIHTFQVANYFFFFFFLPIFWFPLYYIIIIIVVVVAVAIAIASIQWEWHPKKDEFVYGRKLNVNMGWRATKIETNYVEIASAGLMEIRRAHVATSRSADNFSKRKWCTTFCAGKIEAIKQCLFYTAPKYDMHTCKFRWQHHSKQIFEAATETNKKKHNNIEILNDGNPFQAHVTNKRNDECARMPDNFMMAIEKVCIAWSTYRDERERNTHRNRNGSTIKQRTYTCTHVHMYICEIHRK